MATFTPTTIKLFFGGLKKYSGGYKFKIGLNFFRLSAGDYTICFELLNSDYTLWHKTQINVDHQTSSGLSFLSESVKKLTHSYYYPTNNLNYMYYHRVMVSFTKRNSGSSFFHVTVDMPEVGNDMSSYPSEFTKFYVIVYGINGAFGNIDPDRSFDYHTAFDIQPTQVVYNVDINANNNPITNLREDQNSNSAATVGMVKELRSINRYYFYSTLFEEIWDFTKADNYVLNSSSSSTISFNKLKSIKETSSITFPEKTIDNIKYNGLDVINYTLDIPLPDNMGNLNLFVVFQFWSNRDFNLTRYDTQTNTKLFEINYFSNANRITIKSGRQTAYNSPPNNINGKKIVSWVTQTDTTVLNLKINNSNFLHAIGFGRINSTKQKVSFLTKGGLLNKVMFTPNLNLNNSKILIDETLVN